MRKAYILKRLTGQVKRLAAFMLITLMAVGNAFAEEVTFVFSEQGYSNEQVLTAGDINDVISFIAAKNSASYAPRYYNSGNAVRFYAHAASGNGSSMTLIPQAGYEITGLVINATGASNAPVLGVEVDGGARVTYEADGAVYTISGLHAASSLMFINAATANTQLRATSITVTYGEAAAPAVAAPVFSVPTGNYYTEQTVALTCETPGANIFYTVNGGDLIAYNAPFTISATAQVAACAILGEDTSAVAVVNYTFPVFVNNIAAYYAAENADLFKITGDLTFVYRSGRYMYVKDATGGLLVYDSYNPTITTEYNEGDVFTGGLVGNRSMYHGLDEFVPTMNTAEGEAGQTVAPLLVTAAELLANPEQYVSQLVMVADGEFAAGSFNTNSTTNVNFTQNGSTIAVRNAFKTVSRTFAEGDEASVIGFVTLYDNAVQLYPRSNADIITNVLPFTCSFENNSGILWTLVNGENANKWYIGEAAGFDNSKLYISSSNGLTNKYNVSAASVSHAYMDVTLPASDVLLTFDVRSMGEANDFLQVSILDEAPEAGVLPDNSLTRIYNVGEFSTKTILIPASYAGAKKLVFTWSNNNANGTQTPAAIDNVKMESTCTQVSNIAATVNEHTAVVTWNAPEGQTSWTLEYKDVNGDAWQTVNATSTSVTLNNLSTEVTYDVRVKANCDENNSSVWATSQFYVPCIDLTTSQEELVIGNGTSTSNTAPMNSNWRNSYTQMIYEPANFNGPGYINSISWEVSNTTVHNYTSLKIYLANTEMTTNGSNTSWVPQEDLVLVYESENGSIGGASGWVTYNLSTPFYYNGEGGLAIVTSRTAANYNSVNYRYTNKANAVLYRRSDTDAGFANYPGTNTGSRTYTLPNMRLDFTGYVCGDEHCAAPAELTVSDVTTNSAVLNWEGNADSYVLSCKAADAADWMTINVTGNTYTLNDLDQNTAYMVRVKADCGSIGMSDEAVVNFTTVATCIAPQNLTAEATAHTVNVSWLPVEGVNNYEAVVTGANSDYSIVLPVQNASQFSLTSLVEGEQYNIMVRAICSEEDASEWSSINFTMPTICPAPTGLTAQEIGENSAIITWNAGDASAWTVECGPAGFTLGEGTQIVVNENAITLTGLNAYSSYDVYVKADCGLGYTSDWSSVLSFRTECGLITITEANPWVEDFESYSGSGNLAFDDCWATPELTSFNSPFIYRNYTPASHSGKNSAELKGNNGAVATLVLPAFTNPLSDLEFSYFGRVTGSTPGTMQLGYILDPNDASSFVEVMQIPAQSGSYNRANAMYYGPFTFGDNVPNGARITLRFTSATNNCSWNLDDFTVGLKPDCTSPIATSLVVSDVTATTATVAWTDENENNTAWRIYYKAADAAEWQAMDASESPVTITGLTPTTSYMVNVVTVCGTQESGATFDQTFATKMVPASIPYATDFTGNDWKLNNGTCASKWTMGTPSNKDYPCLYISNDGGATAAYANTSASGVSAEKLFEMPADETVHISFDLESGGESTYDYLKVFLAPGDNEYPATTSNTSGTYTHYTFSTYALNFTPYLTQTGVTYTSTNYQYKINLTKGNILHIDMDVTNPAPNGLGKLVFFWRNDGSMGTQPGAIISNLQVGDLSCLPVTDVVVSNVTGSIATLSWTPGALETEWNVAYKTADAENWTTETSSATSYTLTNLQGMTEYQVAVTPVCDGSTAEAATAVFTTLCGNSCDYTFVLHDSYGDGWNGNEIDLVFSNGTTQTLTLSSGDYASYNVSIPEGATMTCNWYTGSYASETSFEIIDGCGTTVFTGSGAQSSGFFSGQCPLPSCPKPTDLIFTDLTGTTAVVSWTAAGEETAWVLEYKSADAEDWTTVEVSNTTYALTGLAEGTNYNVRVMAVCGADVTSSYLNGTFTTCFDGCVYTFELADSYGDGWNGNAITVAFSDGTSQTLTIGNGDYASYTLTIPAGETMTCTWVLGSYPSETSFLISDPCGQMVYYNMGYSLSNGETFFTQECAAISCPAPVALSATEVENGSSVVTWFAGGEETSWQITLTPEAGDAVTAVVTTPTYTITGMEPGDTYTVAVKALCDENDESEEVTTTVVCPALVDIALLNVYTNPSSCDLSNVIARITVRNVMENPISTFEAYYTVNNGEEVHETVTLDTPMDEGDIYTYTFNQAPSFTAASNVITAWVVIPSETNINDNTASSGTTYLTEMKSVPYTETFTSSNVATEWFVMDNNQDGASFEVANGAIRYITSDEETSDDIIVSPCLDMSEGGNYIVTFDYKANSPYYDEQFSMFFSPSAGAQGGDILPVGTKVFHNTEYAHAVERVLISEWDDYDYEYDINYLNIKAESGVGTDGFTIDNIRILKTAPLAVLTPDHHGTAQVVTDNIIVSSSAPIASMHLVPDNENVTIAISAQPGYHVQGIYSTIDGNMVLLRGENPNNAAEDFFSFNGGQYTSITVLFAPNNYNVNATVNNLYVTPYNNNALGATYTPNHEVVAHGGNHTGVLTVADYYHLEYVNVNGMDVTSNLVALSNNQYQLTLNNIWEDKDIQAVVGLDSTTITYTVLAGEGTINNTFVVDGTTTLPATYTVTLPGYADLLSTITPAPGYHVESIIIDGVEHNIIDIYSFEHLLGNHTVVVTFAPSHFVITTEGVGNGTVSNGVEFVYNPDITYVFTATPAVGSRIAYVKRNNVTLNVADPTVAFTDTLTNITTNYHYVAEFVDNTFTVTATAGAHGTVSPAGVASYFYHQTADYNINAAEGYYISSITVDGEVTNYTQADNLTSVVRTFANIEANHTISAAFAAKSYEITVNAGANGTIAPATATYAYGATPTFAITPNAGYVITDVTVDGASVGAVSTYTFTALTADHTIAATFAAAQFSIVATAGNGGTITPAGTTNMAYNGNQTYTISANAGYHVSDVFVDGASVGAVTSYSFTGVTANHTIYAAFEANEYTVTVNQPANGSITPGTTTVLFGATPSFVITPNMGYNVTAISVNGSNVNLSNVPSVNGVYTYTFAAVNANQTITATMTAKTYTITASAGSNGSITPNGNTSVNHGASQTYTINPANGYVVENVTVDGMSMGALTAYTFTNVVANHTINATFKLAECEVPTFLYTTHIDSTSAELHWSHPSATSFDIQYKTPTGNLANVSNVSGNSYVLTDLTPNTTYLWQVRANCTSSNHSDWSNLVSFKTDATTIDNTGIEDVVMNNVKVWAEHQNVHILNNEGMNIENVRIFNAYGKLIYSGAVNTTHEVINLNVAAGTYIVNVTTDQGVANYKVTILK